MPVVGDQIGKYRLTEPIGTGADGAIWRAHHVTLDLPVQLSVLRSDSPAAPMVRVDPGATARLNHAHIVRFHDCGLEGGREWAALEHVDGLSLGELIRQGGRLRSDRVARLGSQVADALAAAERTGLVHGDLRPSTVLLTRRGVAKLTCPGVCMPVLDKGADGAALPGSAAVARESAACRAPDARLPSPAGDRYALGVLLYHAVVGRPPFEGAEGDDLRRRHAGIAPAPPHIVVPAVPAELSAVIVRLLDKSPEARFADHDECAAALAELTTRLEAALRNVAGGDGAWLETGTVKAGASGIGATPPRQAEPADPPSTRTPPRVVLPPEPPPAASGPAATGAGANPAPARPSSGTGSASGPTSAPSAPVPPAAPRSPQAPAGPAQPGKPDPGGKQQPGGWSLWSIFGGGGKPGGGKGKPGKG